MKPCYTMVHKAKVLRDGYLVSTFLCNWKLLPDTAGYPVSCFLSQV